MTHKTPTPARRRFLRAAIGGIGLLGGTTAGLTLGWRPARAGDYKALVCISLVGGNDGINTIVPIDNDRYGAYAAVRGALTLPREQLVPLSGCDFGLHPSLSALGPAWLAGDLVPVFNVGPRSRAMSKTELVAAVRAGDRSALPDSLFSHADQQVLWATAGTDTLVRTGWGGRALAALGGGPVVTLGSSLRFGLSEQQSSLALPPPGFDFGAFGLRSQDLTWAPFATRKTAIDAMYVDDGESLLGDAFRRIQRDAFDVSSRLAALVKTEPGQNAALLEVDSAFATLTSGGVVTTGLARQLYQVAKLIALRGSMDGSRQIFAAQLDGFDNHAGQVAADNVLNGTHARLLSELGDALAAFHAAMVAIGMGSSVTSFTQSDFGRTLAPNRSLGTDHGWGNHHLVIGGAVKGGSTYGRYPMLQLGGPDDIGVAPDEQQGRWIPTTSVDQYAGTLLRWLGLSDSLLGQVLPNLEPAAADIPIGFV